MIQGLGIAPLIVGGVIAGSAAGGAAAWPWITSQAQLLCQTYGWCDDPTITSVDLSPVAPQVGTWTPETASIYQATQYQRDVQTIAANASDRASVGQSYADSEWMNYLPLIALGVGVLFLLRR